MVMKILFTEDAILCPKMLNRMFSDVRQCDLAVNGDQLIEAVKHALIVGNLHDQARIDRMMPNLGGHEALIALPELEKEKELKADNGVRMLKVNALGDPKYLIQSFCEGATGYFTEPITRAKLVIGLKKPASKTSPYNRHAYCT